MQGFASHGILSLMHPLFAIIIVNWNGKKDSREALQSLRSVKTPHITYLVDNGSTDNSLEELMGEFPEVDFIDAGANLGFAGGNNLAIRIAMQKGATLFFLLNNDTVVEPNILDAFLEAVREKPKGGIFGAKSFSYNAPKHIDHFGGIWKEEIGEFISIGRGKEDKGFDIMQSVDYVCGCAMVIKKELFEKIGLLDERFFLLWEESDFCFRARREGFEIWTVPKAHLYHKVSSSFEGKAQSHYYWWRGRLLFLKKNIPFSIRNKIYRCVMRDGWKEGRHFLVKGFLLLLCKLFYTKGYTKKRVKRWKRNRAALLAMIDFARNRFGRVGQRKKNPF